MNLAEIRKKAQREAQQETEPFAARQAPQDAGETSAQAFEEPARPAHAAPEKLPHEQQEQPRQQPSYPAAPAPEPVELNSDFEPLELILKGREKAAVAAAHGEEEREQGAATLELLCFKISTEEYAISIMDVKEIIKPREVTEVPRTPPFVSGIISLRGIIIPVFDLRLRLGLPPQQASRRERIVVVKRHDGFCGVMVDQVVQVVRIGLASVEPPPAVLEGIDRDFVQGIGRVDGRMLILLNMEKVLDVALS